MQATSTLPARRPMPLTVAWRRLRRYPATVFGILIVSFFLLMTLIGPLVAPYGFSDQKLSDRLKPPSSAHVFGTDQLAAISSAA